MTEDIQSDCAHDKGVNDLFAYVESYPNHPGYRKTDTSRAAANDMKPRMSRLQGLVVNALKQHGALATFEIAAKLERPYRSIQPRTSELRLSGVIQDTKERRVDPETGKRAIVWGLCNA